MLTLHILFKIQGFLWAKTKDRIFKPDSHKSISSITNEQHGQSKEISYSKCDSSGPLPHMRWEMLFHTARRIVGYDISPFYVQVVLYVT